MRAGSRRRRRVVRQAGGEAADIELDGRPCVDFCSNDYLGLSTHPRVVEALRRGRARARRRRARLAPDHRTPDASTKRSSANSPTGPVASARSCSRPATWRTSASRPRSRGREDTVFGDRLNHASLIDGGRLSRAAIRVYPHADAAALDAAARSAQTSGRALVLTDGVFSMDGDLAPLPELAAVCATPRRLPRGRRRARPRRDRRDRPRHARALRPRRARSAGARRHARQGLRQLRRLRRGQRRADRDARAARAHLHLYDGAAGRGRRGDARGARGRRRGILAARARARAHAADSASGRRRPACRSRHPRRRSSP